jgi:hypothetical protein
MFHNNSRVRIGDVTDGTSNVFMIGETRYLSLANGYPTGALTWASALYPDNNAQLAVVLAGAVEPINSVDLNPARDNTGNYQSRLFGSHHTGGATSLTSTDLCDSSMNRPIKMPINNQRFAMTACHWDPNEGVLFIIQSCATVSKLCEGSCPRTVSDRRFAVADLCGEGDLRSRIVARSETRHNIRSSAEHNTKSLYLEWRKVL